jgi:hypothetical protein
MCSFIIRTAHRPDKQLWLTAQYQSRGVRTRDWLPVRVARIGAHKKTSRGSGDSDAQWTLWFEICGRELTAVKAGNLIFDVYSLMKMKAGKDIGQKPYRTEMDVTAARIISFGVMT